MTKGKMTAVIAAVVMVVLIAVGVTLGGFLARMSGGQAESRNRALLMTLKTEDYQQRTVGSFNEDFRPVADLFDGFGRRESEPEFMLDLFRSSMELVAEENDELPCLYDVIYCGDYELEFTLTWELETGSITVGTREEILNQCLEETKRVFGSRSGDQLEEEGALQEIQRELDAVSRGLSVDGLEVTLRATRILSNRD